MGIFAEMDLEQRNVPDGFSDAMEPEAFEEGQGPVGAVPDEVPMLSEENLAADTDTPSTEEPSTAGKEPVKAASEAESEDEKAKRKAHEEAEAKRKAEWEAKCKAKKAAEQAQLEKIASMSDQDVMTSSMQRIGADTERLTRRNMKECVSEYIQTLCLSDPAFARRAMHPRKSMIHCIWFINRKAQEFVQKEMEDNGLKPERNGIYGSDVPDDLCYQWAEEYFNDPDAKEDQEEEEKFVPKPYPGKTKILSKSAPKGKTKKAEKKVEEKKPAPEKAAPSKSADAGQMTLGDFGMLGESA